jgi:hypothetical protein
MHHLILVREFDQQVSGCGGGVTAAPWVGVSAGDLPAGRLERANAIGAVYRAVREAFGEEVRITVVDPRNQISFVPLVLGDAVRYSVPALTALRTVLSAGASTGIFDGQVLFRGEVPDPGEVVERIRGRMRVHRVGAAPEPGEEPSDDR